MPDITSLPKWAQHKIAKLEADVALYRERMRQMDTGNSNTVLRGLDTEDDVHLPPNALIRFQFGEGWQEYMDCRVMDGGLEVHGFRALAVLPGASNTIQLRLWD